MLSSAATGGVVLHGKPADAMGCSAVRRAVRSYGPHLHHKAVRQESRAGEQTGPAQGTSCVRTCNCWLLQPGFVVREALATTGSGLHSVGSSRYLPIASAVPASHLCTIWMPNSSILGHFSPFLSKMCSPANTRQMLMT